MYLLFYLLNLLPNFGIRLISGQLPLRYLSVSFILSCRRFPKNDKWLIYLSVFFVVYSFLSSWIRPIHGLDIAYSFFFIYVFVFKCIVFNSTFYFSRFILLFWAVNVVYAFVQTAFLNLGVESSYLMLHQNAHSLNYEIPGHSYMPGLYRVTGLFVESAPFVIFLMIFSVYLKIFNYGLVLRGLNYSLIFFAGAKVGFLYLFLIFLNYINRKLRLGFSFIGFAFVSVVLLVAFISDIKVLVLNVNDYVGGLGSIWVRLDGLDKSFSAMSDNLSHFFWGYGHVSSSQLMSGDYMGPKRGIDFYSTFILSYGVLGTLLSITIFYVWIIKTVRIKSVYMKNHFFIISMLMLLTMGSIQQFQYALLFVLLSIAGVDVSRKVLLNDSLARKRSRLE